MARHNVSATGTEAPDNAQISHRKLRIGGIRGLLKETRIAES